LIVWAEVSVPAMSRSVYRSRPGRVRAPSTRAVMMAVLISFRCLPALTPPLGENRSQGM